MKTEEVNRQPRMKKSPSDLSREIDASDFTFDKNDCFGGLWDIEDRLCRLCHDNVVCGILFAKKVALEETRMQRENEKFLDTVDFENINKDALCIWLSTSAKSVDDFFDYVAKKASCSDEVAVVEYIKRFTLANGFKIRNSVIIVK